MPTPLTLIVSALITLHASVEDWPGLIEVGVPVKKTICTGSLALVCMMHACAALSAEGILYR